jgi:precorrin-3B synthase
MSVDRKAWGWCPSVLRPMPLDDGLMVRIRVPGGALTAAQAEGLADVAARFGAGFIEVTNRANLQLRGLTEAEHVALVPELDALGLAEIDRTPSGRVNITQSPFRDGRAADIAARLAEGLSAVEFKALPQKFGYVIDTGPDRVLAEVPGDVRIEAAGDALILRADGMTTGRVVDDPVEAALDIARWFIGSGMIGADGRGRMADHGSELPTVWRGKVEPNGAVDVDVTGPEWLRATEGRLAPGALRGSVAQGIETLRITPFRALYLPDLAPDAARDMNAETGMRGSGAHAV